MFSFQPLWRARFNNAFGMSPTYIARAPWFVNDLLRTLSFLYACSYSYHLGMTLLSTQYHYICCFTVCHSLYLLSAKLYVAHNCTAQLSRILHILLFKSLTQTRRSVYFSFFFLLSFLVWKQKYSTAVRIYFRLFMPLLWQIWLRERNTRTCFLRLQCYAKCLAFGRFHYVKSQIFGGRALQMDPGSQFLREFNGNESWWNQKFPEPEMWQSSVLQLRRDITSYFLINLQSYVWWELTSLFTRISLAWHTGVKNTNPRLRAFYQKSSSPRGKKGTKTSFTFDIVSGLKVS